MAGILAKLNVNSNEGISGYVIYFLIFLYLITLFLQKKSDFSITLLLAGAVMAALLDKIQAFRIDSFGAFLMHVAMFAAPLIAGGMTKWERSRPPAIFAGVIGVLYFIARWYGDIWLAGH